MLMVNVYKVEKNLTNFRTRNENTQINSSYQLNQRSYRLYQIVNY